MGNRIGVIFHEDWNCFSPLLYSHYGASTIRNDLQVFLEDYKTRYPVKTSDHLYNTAQMMASFIKFLDEDIHLKIANIPDVAYDRLQRAHHYYNGFEGGCILANVTMEHYGELVICTIPTRL